MKTIGKAFQILIILSMVALFIRGMAVLFSSGGASDIRNDCIVVLELNGVIKSSDKLMKKFKMLEENRYVKGYILKIDSPGGAVTPSQELYEYLLTLEKPLYVSMQTQAASGGYMVALAANRIYAMPSTITGSIGVLTQYNTYEELMSSLGIKNITIKSGVYKDTGSPFREPTQEEIAQRREVIMDLYDQFIQIVSTRRNMDIEEVKALADGSIYTGQMAEKNGLIDRIGSCQDVFVEMKQDLDMPDLKMIELQENKGFGYIFNEASSNFGGFYYIYKY